MKIVYTVQGFASAGDIASYTTKDKALELVHEHLSLKLFIIERPVSFYEWLFLKIMLR